MMFHGDVLEAVVSHVPLIDLAAACDVSKEWQRAVFSSLRHLSSLKPWLFFHAHSHSHSTLAYDPRSHLWLSIHHPPLPPPRHVSDNTLFRLSPSSLSVSVDPLHFTWRHLPAPRVWRIDPLVAVVSHLVVVAGGACDFEDDALSVEVYDLRARAWKASPSMPDFFKQRGSATWLTVACNGHEMFVTEKCSGVTHSFNPATGEWRGPYDLHRWNEQVFYSAVGFSAESRRMMMVGLVGESASEVRGVKVWEVKEETSSSSSSLSLGLKEMGEMPERMVKKLMRDGDSEIDSIGVCCAGDYVYVYNPTLADEVVVAEFITNNNSNNIHWSSVAVTNAGIGKFHFTTSMVGVHHIQRALRLHNWKFTVKI